MTRMSRLLLLGLAVCPAGCLVPLPLSQEVPSDGGLQLFIDRADPPFGTQKAMQSGEFFLYHVYVRTDSPNLAGRLCVQLNGTCCVLQPDNIAVTHCGSDANIIPIGQPGAGGFDVSYPKFAPCFQTPITTAYVVPVLATGGFDDSGGIIGANGLGTVDQSHFWEVHCP